MGKGDLGMLQQGAGGGGRGPSPTWILGTSTGISNPSWAGTGGLVHSTKGLSPSLPWDKAKVLLEFWERKESGMSLLLCSEGEPTEGLLQGTPAPPWCYSDHKIPQNKGELWLWNCSRSGMLEQAAAHSLHTFPSTPGWSSTLTENPLPIQKLPMNSKNAALPNSSSSLSKYLLKKPQCWCLEKLFGYKNL